MMRSLRAKGEESREEEGFVASMPWHVRLFADRSPAGFNAGDANLYRYVGNDPTDATDPTGLAPEYGTWDFWASEPRKVLDITGKTDSAYVKNAIAQLDKDFSLDKIPWVSMRVFRGNYGIVGGKEAPKYQGVGRDHAGGLSGAPNGRTGTPDEWKSIATPAQLARINIRVNLLSLKQSIVSEVCAMLLKRLPVNMALKPGEINEDAFEQAANDIADTYIRAVDQFLKDHPGARPQLGSRNAIADALGLQDEKNAPWCADWAPAMTKAMIDLSSKYIGVDHGQYKKPGTIWDTEHNFMIVRPRGYSPVFLPKLDDVILLFDPWRDLLPRVYHPSQKENDMYPPTNTYP